VENVDESGEVHWADALVKSQTDTIVVDLAEVDAHSKRSLVDLFSRGNPRDVDGQRVEVCVVNDLVPKLLDFSLEDSGEVVNALSNLLDALRTVIDCVHRGSVGEKCLRGTDVARRFLASDMLLAGYIDK
jgi:hypothetical protein